MDCAMIGGTIAKVHRYGQGEKGGSLSQAVGRSRGGMATKIIALTGALGNVFGRLKEFKRIAMRSCKTDAS